MRPMIFCQQSLSKKNLPILQQEMSDNLLSEKLLIG